MASEPTSIRSLFSAQRPIERPIEKVIDYSRDDAERLAVEIEEYEVTSNVQRGIQRFLDKFGDALRGTPANETAIWVSGFYGSGKSSFTKYLGFALDPSRTINGKPFVELLAERIPSDSVRQELRTLANQYPVAVIMLDLGSEQLASSATVEVSNVLYRKVLQWAGYSQVAKVAELELKLDREGRYGDFQIRYGDRFGGDWDAIHDDPLVAVSRADQLVFEFFPKEFPTTGDFRKLQYSLVLSAREQAEDMLEIIYRKSGHKNVLFLIDEVGQYVAPKGELILNLDGLARNLKELGQGHVWIMATGQQTLAEIVEKAAYNSTELNKLRDRFPVSIELDATDIREITHRRLLRKSPDGETRLKALFQQYGQSLVTHTRLADTGLYRGDVDAESFINLYPFLPSHFDVLLNFISSLARASGGLGLRSAIRVIQDVLVDTSRVLLPGAPKLADQPVGILATADRFYDSLRNDILKVASHSVAGVDRIEQIFPDNDLAVRIGKTVAVLQQLPGIPRTPANIAALLYWKIGESPNREDVQSTLDLLLNTSDVGMVDDPQGGGLAFLDEGVRPIREKRNAYRPSSADLARQRSEVLKSVFSSLPAATLEGSKNVRAGIRFGSQPIDGYDNEIQFQLESTTPGTWDERRTEFLTDTAGANKEWENTIVWLMQPPEAIEDALLEALQSDRIIRDHPEHQVEAAVATFVRAERRNMGAQLDKARELYRESLLDGVLIFRGKATPARSSGVLDVDGAARMLLQTAATQIYPKYGLVKINPKTDLAVRFLAVEKLDRMPSEDDPLRLVSQSGGQAGVDPSHPALQETLSAIKELIDRSGAPRIQGNTLQDELASAPYGWSKDAVRYLVAGLLTAGEISLATSSGVVSAPGQAAREALKNTQAFNKVGVAIRDSRPSLGQIRQAATRLTELIGKNVNFLEDQIRREADVHIPEMLEPLTTLPYQLATLGLPGIQRVEQLLAQGKQIQATEGAEAINILGGTTASFVDDYKWSTRVSKALQDGGKELVQETKALESGIQGLSDLAPEAANIWRQHAPAIHDLLGSESFDSGLPNLRSACRTTREQLVALYAQQFEAYCKEMRKLLERLEGAPGWRQIPDDDKQDIALRTEVDMVSSAQPGTVVEMLRTLAIRRLHLSRLEQDLREEIQRKQPAPQSGVTDRPIPVVVEIDGRRIAAELTSEADLEEWLLQIRAEFAIAISVQERVEAGVAS